MTGQRETTRYATAVLRKRGEATWLVDAQPWDEFVGSVFQASASWTAHTQTGLYAGLWPTKQAAAEALVKQAGYELEMR